MNDQTSWRDALARAERLATSAVMTTRGLAAPRSYAELSRRLDDAEIVLELLARADAHASLARTTDDEGMALEHAEIAETLAREASVEALRRACSGPRSLETRAS